MTEFEVVFTGIVYIDATDVEDAMDNTYNEIDRDCLIFNSVKPINEEE